MAYVVKRAKLQMLMRHIHSLGLRSLCVYASGASPHPRRNFRATFTFATSARSKTIRSRSIRSRFSLPSRAPSTQAAQDTCSSERSSDSHCELSSARFAVMQSSSMRLLSAANFDAPRSYRTATQFNIICRALTPVSQSHVVNSDDWYSWVGSNHRPPVPQTGALTN